MPNILIVVIKVISVGIKEVSSDKFIGEFLSGIENSRQNLAAVNYCS